MDFKEHYKKRLSYNGNSAREGLVERTRRIAEEHFSRSPSYYIADINGVKRGVIINNTSRYEEKLINVKPSENLDLGSVVEYKDNTYLVVEKDQDEVYKFGKMRFCNNEFVISKVVDKTLIGKGENGQPIYEETVTEKKVPCVVSDKYYSASQNAQLQLPEGKLTILLQYQDMPNVKANTTFKMYGKKYKVMDVGYTQVVNDVGYVQIDSERVIVEGSDIID